MGKRPFHWLRRSVFGLLAIAVGLTLLALVLRQPADSALYPAQGSSVTIHLVDHGYHAGLILPRGRLMEIAKEQNLTRLSTAINVFEFFDHVEIGWGEENFYQSVPEASISALPHILRALFNPANRSVLHLVGLNGDGARAFPGSSTLSFNVTNIGLQRLAAAIDSEFRLLPSGDVAPLGPGLYGPSAFFGAVSRYHLFNTCNHWAGRMLAVAGLPYSPVEATLSVGLRHDLYRRAPRL